MIRLPEPRTSAICCAPVRGVKSSSSIFLSGFFFLNFSTSRSARPRTLDRVCVEALGLGFRIQYFRYNCEGIFWLPVMYGRSECGEAASPSDRGRMCLWDGRGFSVIVPKSLETDRGHNATPTCRLGEREIPIGFGALWVIYFDLSD